MGLPLNLAMTQSEIVAAQSLPADFAWMSCHFSPAGVGLANLPAQLPEGAMLILDDSIPCNGHSADVIARTLREFISRASCSSVLLDFQRPDNSQAAAIAAALVDTLPCPVGVTPEYAERLSCPVFLPPAPLHMPLEKYLRPWKKREIWLEAALCQEVITVAKSGTIFSSEFSTTVQAGGFFDEKLCCRHVSNIQDDHVTFTLFDTPEALEKKLELARSLGVTRAVGLYQELSQYFAAR